MGKQKTALKAQGAAPAAGTTMPLTDKNSAVLEYLDVVKDEYDIERNKKQSFENRAGLVLALLGAICIFLFDSVKPRDIVAMFSVPLTFVTLIQILSGIAVYVALVFTVFMVLRTINTQQHDNFEVKSIDEALLTEPRIDALCRIIYTYRDIIVQHRERNEKRAWAYRCSLIGIAVTLFAVIIYVSMI